MAVTFLTNEDKAVLDGQITALFEEIEAMKDGGGTTDKVVSVTYSYNGYVHSGGYLNTHTTYQVSDVIPLYAGETISFVSAVPDPTAVYVLSMWNEDGSQFVKGLLLGTNEEQMVKYTASQAIEYLRITHSSRNDYVHVYNVTITTPEDQFDVLAKEVESLKDTVSRQLLYHCFPFIRLGIVGDSLASGASNFTDVSGTGTCADRPEYSWGKFMGREHGIDVELFSEGGISTQTWLTRSAGLAAMQAAEACDCYIIGLGVNDKYMLGDDYLGSSADVTVGSEDGNADSFYGNYSKIIAALLVKSPRCKIFCLTMPSAQGEDANTYNVAIRDLVEMYDNAHLIDLENDEFYSGEQYTSTWNGAHSTAPGYKIMAEHLWKLMNDYIMANVSSFTDVQWILEDHT